MCCCSHNLMHNLAPVLRQRMKLHPKKRVVHNIACVQLQGWPRVLL